MRLPQYCLPRFAAAVCLASIIGSISGRAYGGEPANLLTENPSFETPGGFGGGHGVSRAGPGWEIDYFGYDNFGVQDGDAADGARCLSIGHGARVTTAADCRAAAAPGRVYEMGFDAKTVQDSNPAVWNGIEFYGDSITSGGQPDPLRPDADPNKDEDYAGNFARTYAAFTANALAAEWVPISKGATGVSGSFVFKYTMLDYFDRLDFDGWNPEKAKPWDFKLWQPHAVVITVGHNDQFRKPSDEAFVKSYATLVARLRTAYPQADIFCSNTSMSGGAQWKMAVLPLLKTDPKLHFQMFDPGQGHGGHPRFADHQAMALGNENWRGLAEWIGDTLNW